MDALQKFCLDQAFNGIIIFNNVYYSSDALQSIVAFFYSALKTILVLFSGMRKDPNDPVWYSFAWSTTHTSIEPIFREYNQGYLCSMEGPLLSDNNCADMLIVAFDESFSKETKNLSLTQITMNDPLLVCKLPPLESHGPDVYLFRRWHPLRSGTEDIFKNALLRTGLGFSNTTFLACTYKCGSTNISFDIPKNWTVIGNELFSSTFMQRLLQTQPWPYTMDTSYTVELFDSNMEFLILSSNQYLRMENSRIGYVVCDMNTNLVVENMNDVDNDSDSEPFELLEKDKLD